MDLENTTSIFINGYSLPLLVALAGVSLLLIRFFKIDIDPKEPPLIQPVIPFIGHGVGLWRRGNRHFYDVYVKHPSYPAYTMPVLGGKLYVINEAGLMQTAFRSGNFSMYPIVANFIGKLVDMAPRTRESLADGIDDPKRIGYFHELETAIFDTMKPGTAGLEDLTRRTHEEIPRMFDTIGSEWQDVGSLYEWLWQNFGLAVMKAFYGREHNPFLLDGTLVQALWDFDVHMHKLILELPRFMAPTAHTARSKLVAALTHYFANGYDKDEASLLIQARGRAHRNRDTDAGEIAKIELLLAQGGVTNTIPMAFWILLSIFSDVQLLEDVRSEVEKITRKIKGQNEMIIDATALKDDGGCPLLVSVFHEVMRLNNHQAGLRIVLNDTLITSGPHSYLLKKGNALQMPAGIIHHSSQVWGPNVEEFHARRFLKASSETAEHRETERMQKRNLIPFGGGKHLCPGRHLAFAEVLAVAAVFVMGVEMVDEQGKVVRVPQRKRNNLAEGVARPVGEGLGLKVKMRRRRGFENVRWTFSHSADAQN